jgi:spermidine synthase
MNKIKHLLSFIYPVLIESRLGEVNPYLEVKKFNGQYILNSETVNYSYGDHYELFDSLFYKINIQQRDFTNVLVLGMGAGSVISLLTEKYGRECKITAIEKDGVVIELAKNYFDIERFGSLTVINDDASKFVSETKETFDLIIVDLFIDMEVPKQFSSIEFISNLKRIATTNCCVIYNKITNKLAHKKELEVLFLEFGKIFPSSEIYKVVGNATENSFIYCNTLPFILQELKIVKNERSNQDPVIYSNLKPAFNHD